MAKVVRKKGTISLDDLKQIFDGLDDKTVQAGWFESARYDAQTPVAGIASVQEFGTVSGGIPPRPFIRPTINDNKSNWIDYLSKNLKGVLNGQRDLSIVLEGLGFRVAGQIRQKISTIYEPPLSPITLALRKQRLTNPDNPITGKTVGATAAAIAEGRTNPGELGDSSGINPKPLIFTNVLLTTVSHAVGEK